MKDQASGLGPDYSSLGEALGGKDALAAVLDVSAGQISRWSRGLDPASEETANVLADLDRIVSKARMLWGLRAVTEWFQGANASLNGARPVDALAARRSSEVMDALEAAEAGAPG